MAFTKGMKRHPQAGNKKGSTHPVTFPKARAEIIASGKNPIKEVIALIPSLEPRDQVKAWFELQSWLESKPTIDKDKHESDIEGMEEFVRRLEHIPTEYFLKLVSGEIKESAMVIVKDDHED